MANLLPAICDLSVTNVCNAACDFCGFARDKTLTGPARYVDTDAYFPSAADPVPARDSIPDAARRRAAGASQHRAAGLRDRYIDQLAAAGLDRLIISIDSANLAEHELNRG